MSDGSTTALVTGANKGIGRAVARRLAALGMTVLVGARDVDKGAEAAAEIRAAGGTAYPIGLDVTDPSGVTTAAEEVGDRFGRLDVLVNNAGIAGDLGAQAPGSTRLDGVRAVFETNLFGVITVTEAMLPLLRRSSAARIVNVSSGTSSMTWTTDATHYLSRMPSSLGYPVSKAALNMLTVQYAKALSRDGILVNAVAPGACDTDFAKGLPFQLTRTADDGAEIVVRLATQGRECPTGGFFDDGGKVPW
ncbi:NAD(P)-dependent dehydrogenase (short-subunit alcohol dehydrogenase family) [Motilibacter peucedani]|uniref:NAD(P)-dependent dehydrogenase (Short-subunit alcohol dehydrogenase family) n=1 Tax=Motilibacter peucedani TaxID=598650 RepID=A0A420XSS0_9ACTN|nr:SDR family NAD(P)-dependent oxidoreductase [Motilibacter peucedani]RKS77861.1 NAD(P)-dependent dehydrogenase (short-subunit alcohol dehydrogenase family) [Motilibacter peucedani]